MTINEQRGDFEITIRGEARPARLSATACNEFKRMTKSSVLQALRRMGDDVDEEVLFRLMYVAIHECEPDLKYEAFATNQVRLTDALVFVERLPEVIGTTFGDEKNAQAGTVMAATS